ncbi:MAG: hypothetical protein E7515_00025 [Ruminococcaceae bacterium]|nr:hypothetical protein [Oscillospiraceae bacterium]
MNVWIINLKDNSGDGSKKNTPYKFEFCKDKSIIGIGWRDPIDNNNKDYQNALQCLEKMKKDDLVWTRHPQDKDYYLCKVIGDLVILHKNIPTGINEQEYFIQDISAYRKVKFYKLKCNVKNLIDYKKLISRSTARAVFDTKIIELTEDIITREGIQ